MADHDNAPDIHSPRDVAFKQFYTDQCSNGAESSRWYHTIWNAAWKAAIEHTKETVGDGEFHAFWKGFASSEATWTELNYQSVKKGIANLKEYWRQTTRSVGTLWFWNRQGTAFDKIDFKWKGVAIPTGQYEVYLHPFPISAEPELTSCMLCGFVRQKATWSMKDPSCYVCVDCVALHQSNDVSFKTSKTTVERDTDDPQHCKVCGGTYPDTCAYHWGNPDPGCPVVADLGPSKQAEKSKHPDWFQVEILKAGLRAGDLGALELVAQLAGVPPCEKCGYIKQHCRCASTDTKEA